MDVTYFLLEESVNMMYFSKKKILFLLPKLITTRRKQTDYLHMLEKILMAT